MAAGVIPTSLYSQQWQELKGSRVMQQHWSRVEKMLSPRLARLLCFTVGPAQAGLGDGGKTE